MEPFGSFKQFAQFAYFPFIINRIIGDTNGGNASLNALNRSVIMASTIAAFNNISRMYRSENSVITDINKADAKKSSINKSLLNRKPRYIHRSTHRVSTFKR